ncbi:MAG: hypothetical protein IT567_03005, partial [Alphaproteobacteria bacterium]|nr:hypothetical protein [Alphaproteobacteria bacterium]
MTFRPYFFLIRLTLSVALTALPLSAIAEDTATPMVTGGQVGNNARIIFKWQESVRFTARAQGELLTLEFSKPITADFSPLLARIGNFVTQAEVSDDAKTVTFTLTYPYQIKSFMSKHLSGVDLIDNRVPTTPQAATDTPDKPDSILPPMPGEILPPPLLAKGNEEEGRVSETAAPEDAVADAEQSQPDMLSVFMAPQDGVGRITFDWQVPVRYRVITDKDHVTVEFDREATATLPALSDAMKPYLDSIGSKREDHHLLYMLDLPDGATVTYFNEKHKVVADIHVPKDVLAARTKTLSQPEIKKPAPKSVAAKKPAPSAKPHKTASTKKPATAPKAKASTKPVASAPVASVAVTDYPYVVTFPWNEPVAAAVFSRGSYSWIVFDKPAHADLAPLAQQAFVSDAELLPSDTATIIRFRNPQGLHAQASKDGESWIFKFAPELAQAFASIP